MRILNFYNLLCCHLIVRPYLIGLSILFTFLLSIYHPVFAVDGLGKGEVEAYVTTNTRSHELKRVTFKANSLSSRTTIHLDRNTRFQEMDGFGAAVTGSTCYNLLKMDKKSRTQFLRETFDPVAGYGHSYIRIAIGCSDFSLSEYTCCDAEGIENFALQEEELQYVIPVLKEILAINPTIKILGSPWTSPQWMKVDNLTDLNPFHSWTSGHLNPQYYQDYAIYFVRWIEAFQQEGIDIFAITPQNEPLNRRNSASLFMGWLEQRDFIKSALGPQLKKAGLRTKIFAFDHNYNYDNMADQQGYPLHIYEDDAAAQYITGAAYHNYGGNRQELLRVHDRRPDKQLLFTETSIGTWNHGRDFDKRLIEDMEEVGLGTVNNWCTGVMVWNLMLDSDRGPWREGGCKTCYGAVDIDRKDYKTITKNSHYYVISHLSVVVKPGAVRIGSTGMGDEELVYTGFENKDGSIALVLLNKSKEARTISVVDKATRFSYTVPAKSVVSYLWKG
ncbi:glucosylceramidase [Sphingobacterium psychroaquaticum]|uniref:glycoside hydrolase family 30 protein n=1 Tax=Sphingobacterium psychroaquaticum TaxID=561061 RepID=UPI001069A10B|nr:glycoside hydrolase family 30 beta sandwich domain-containing protein [Sphingobacterium psychroaquaticum]QBQ40166.1 glucosylceramidase [Sphingobacterium psychroaquaticum]